MTIGTQNNKSHAVKLKPPGVGAPNGFRYTPEGYCSYKNIVYTISSCIYEDLKIKITDPLS